MRLILELGLDDPDSPPLDIIIRSNGTRETRSIRNQLLRYLAAIV